MKPYPKPERTSKPKKRRSKGERQLLEERLDDLCRQIVRLRDGGTCVICGSTARPQTGHFFVRERMAVRWDLRNVHCQCASCNLKHRFDQQPYTLWFIKTYGLEEYERIYKLAEVPFFKWGVPELYEIERELTQQLALLSFQKEAEAKTRTHNQNVPA